MNGTPKPLWKQIPLPNDQEREQFEQWVEKQEQLEDDRKSRDDVRVIVIDI